MYNFSHHLLYLLFSFKFPIVFSQFTDVQLIKNTVHLLFEKNKLCTGKAESSVETSAAIWRITHTFFSFCSPVHFSRITPDWVGQQ